MTARACIRGTACLAVPVGCIGSEIQREIKGWRGGGTHTQQTLDRYHWCSTHAHMRAALVSCAQRLPHASGWISWFVQQNARCCAAPLNCYTQVLVHGCRGRRPCCAVLFCAVDCAAAELLQWGSGAGAAAAGAVAAAGQKLERSRPNTWALSQSKRMSTRLRKDTCRVSQQGGLHRGKGDGGSSQGVPQNEAATRGPRERPGENMPRYTGRPH